MHNIETVEHLSPAPHYAASPVKVTYLNGGEACSQWGSDVDGGGVLAWRAENGDAAAIAYVPPPPLVPGPLTPRQFNLMLLQIGMTWQEVQDQIDAISDPAERAVADVEFNRATSFRRDHPLVVSLAASFEFTDLEMDTMWEYAGGL